ncbi:hypothetical protein KVG88_01415 [Pseudomonas sp. SWRI74]|jgi:hypothetical protein|uniref:DUF2188 domain-containing protein n=2 Tax=Pseudomonas TaxID=286 RepID=A0A5E7BUY4_PSEFL|nr:MULTISPECIES: hypothetical protein [Pseudomonas]MBV4518705.1 hypothetical protein [Pseudomonas azerbaijanoccidentalis]MCK8668708.1 hypothetical protein [Pseudomonas azerbaijanoccidentalis]VVN93597.1 hypothetical protein PS712_02090 [Pseudomonas fluorescens]
MSAAKSVNGYLINKAKDGQWWVDSASGENIAGPFPTEAMAVEVASVLQLEHPEPKRRGKDKN